jgi:predicted acyltransferase
VKDLYPWGVYWLLLGLTLEPFEGGIKKVPDTMSYYLVSAGLAIFLLIAGTIVIDIWRRQRWLQLLIDNGQNPMIAYVGGENLIWPIVVLTHLDRPIGAITQSSWAGLTAGVLTTLVVAYAVRFFTRLRVFWRT